MNSSVIIPHGDEKITVELTVKEAIALSGGVRFLQGKDILTGARRKVKQTLEQKLLTETKQVDYSTLEL